MHRTIIIITFAKEGILPAFVYLLATTHTDWIFMKILTEMYLWIRKSLILEVIWIWIHECFTWIFNHCMAEPYSVTLEAMLCYHTGAEPYSVTLKAMLCYHTGAEPYSVTLEAMLYYHTEPDSTTRAYFT